MSKIKLTGESSGYVEISAGENAANNTLELPTSGTKIVASDSSNNVNGLGIVTATSFSGALSGTATTATNLADAANITTGTISNDRLPATITKNLTGNVTGDITGNVTGNVTGDITGNVTGQLSGIQTSITVQSTGNITVGESFIRPTSLGVGTTDTTGRDAGIGTAPGTIIYNTTTMGLEVYNPVGVWSPASTVEFTAYSPTVTADTSSRPGWAVFSFTGPGDLIVYGGPAKSAEYLVIAGGGGAGTNDRSPGGGGAGGYRSGSSFTLNPGTYSIQVGGGGVAGGPWPTGGTIASSGTPSYIIHPGITSITSYGGGRGSRGPSTPAAVGGSGGGGGHGDSGAPGINPGTPQANLTPFGLTAPYPITQGYAGVGGINPGQGPGPFTGSGGGGAGGNGSAGSPGSAGSGGAGQSSSITGTSVGRAGGGSGSISNPSSGSSGSASSGGGGGGVPRDGTDGTGGGGGAGGSNHIPGPAGSGGSGIVIIAYPTS
jgi:hypothetical protein